jgi:hypothetical protein
VVVIEFRATLFDANLGGPTVSLGSNLVRREKIDFRVHDELAELTLRAASPPP